MLISDSILKTLSYSDIFDFPLNGREVWKFLIEDRDRDRDRVEDELKKQTKNLVIERKGEYFFLKGREKIVELRNKREEWSMEKIEIARKAANKLSKIPSIKMIGVTGALAMNNCKENDDIDLMIVTSINSLWLTRILIILLCPVFGIMRRKVKDKKFNNKICFNLFLEENHLEIQPESLFLAHEIVQAKPIFDKGNIYERFIKENNWVKKFLPNAIQLTRYQDNKITTKSKRVLICYLASLLSCLDFILFKFQYLYMKSKITCERVSKYQAFFHPGNLQNRIEKEYNERGLKSATTYQGRN